MPAVPGVPAPAPPSPGAMAVARVTIALGGPSSSARQRRPRYVSPATAGVRVLVLPGGASVNASLGPSASGCTTAGGTTTCTITIDAPVGSDNFDITLLDAAGNALSHGAIPQTISPNGANTVGITLDGVVASVGLTPAAAVVPSGSTSPFTVAVVAYDQQHNVILGPGGFDSAIQLDSDQPAHVAIAPAFLTGPLGGVAVNLIDAYAGTFAIRAWTNGTQVGSTTISAQANASPVPTPTATPTATPTPAPTVAPTPAPLPTVPGASPLPTIAAPTAVPSIAPPTPAPSITPLYVIAATSTSRVLDVVDAAGNGTATVTSHFGLGSNAVAVAHNAADGSFWAADAQQTPRISTVSHYSSSGRALQSVFGFASTFLHPSALAINASNGTLWIADDQLDLIIGFTSQLGVAGVFTGVKSPNAVAVDAAGSVYATSNSGSDYLVFQAPGSTPIRDVHLAQASNPVGIAVDATSVYLLSAKPTPRIDQLPLASEGSNPAVTRSITWSASGYTQPAGIAVGPLGNLFVADKGGTVLVFTPSQSGDVLPARTLGGFGSALSVAR